MKIFSCSVWNYNYIQFVKKQSFCSNFVERGHIVKIIVSL